MWFTKPQKIELEVQEQNHERTKKGNRQCWKTKVSLCQGEKKIDEWSCTIDDPFNQPDRNEIHEYFETSAKRDNIDEEKNSMISRKLDEYRVSLFKSLKLNNYLRYCKGKKVEIRIRANKTFRDQNNSRLKKSIHSLHWEHLEDISLWKDVAYGLIYGPVSVSVQRYFKGLQDSTGTPSEIEPFGILLVTARKHIHEDQRYDYYNPTNVLCSILKACSELECQSSLYRTYLEVVRPGTFEEFKASLFQRQRLKKNSYQIVHFDVHGDIS